MGMISVCDGCGKQEPAVAINHHWYKPHFWYERSPRDEKNVILTGCGRKCIEKVEAKRKGKKPMTVVAPF